MLEHPELPWLPTEPEKVGFFESLGIDRSRIPHRVYQGAVGKQTRYFALKLPIAVDAKTATFAYVDPGKDTDTELRSWGAAHEWLWRALRLKGVEVQGVVIGADHTATRRSKAALQSWSNGAEEQGEQRAAGPTQDDPPVKAEMQYIEKALVKLDAAIIAKYGGVKGISKRLIELKTLPRSKGRNRSLDRQLRDVGFAPLEDAGCRPMKRTNGVPPRGAIQDGFCCAPCTMLVPIQPGTQTRGGVYQDSVMRCTNTIFPIYLPQRGLSVIARPARSDPAEKGRTGATPPFLPLYRQTGRGVCNRVCNNPTPLFQGSLPSHLSLREGSGHGPQAGADAPEASHPGKDTDTELRSWGDAHEYLWRALRSKGIEVRAVVVGADYKATIRAEAPLQTWSQRAFDKSGPIEERPSRNDPEVKAEIQHIENSLLTVDRPTIARYGGVNDMVKRLGELKDLPKSSSTIGVTIDGFETWVSDRLRMQDSDL